MLEDTNSLDAARMIFVKDHSQLCQVFTVVFLRIYGWSDQA